jgi:DNA-binding response OmpR family regulator
MRVLIADDSVLLVERLLAFLAPMRGVEIVGHARSAEEAAGAIRSLKPDAVILDLCMPGGSGMDVLKGLKQDHLSPIVIVLTSYGEAPYRRKCLELGAAYFFDKSMEFDKVAEVLQVLVASAPQSGEAQTHRVDREVCPGDALALGEQGLLLPGAEASAQTPSLVLNRSSKGEPLYYICSHCLRGFPLSGLEAPSEAIQEMYESFRQHVALEHTAAVHGRVTAPVI